ncbi:MAG: hypothetical protein ACXIU8_13695 [Alkalilacustris sp.]
MTIHAAMTRDFNDLERDDIVTRAEFVAATGRLFGLLDRDGAGLLSAYAPVRGDVDAAQGALHEDMNAGRASLSCGALPC